MEDIDTNKVANECSNAAPESKGLLSLCESTAVDRDLAVFVDPSDLDDAQEFLERLNEQDLNWQMRASWVSAWARDRFGSCDEWTSWMNDRCGVVRRQALRYLTVGRTIRDDEKRDVLLPYISGRTGLDLDKLEVVSQLPAADLADFAAEVDIVGTPRKDFRTTMIMWWAPRPSCPQKLRKEAAGKAKSRKVKAARWASESARKAGEFAGMGRGQVERAAMEISASETVQAIRNALGLFAWHADNGLVDADGMDKLSAELGQYAAAFAAAAKDMRCSDETLQHDPDAGGPDAAADVCSAGAECAVDVAGTPANV